MEFLGKPVGWFESISDAARKLGYNKDSISRRVKRGLVISGVRIRFPQEGEEYTSLPNLTPPKVYGQCERPKGGSVGRPKTKKPEKGKKEVVYKELDRENYNIIPYEVRNAIQCITPCPFMEAPKFMVGSVQCQRCNSFRGRDTRTHEVACNRSYNGKYL